MGIALIQQMRNFPVLRLAAAIDRPGSAALGKEAGSLAAVDSFGVSIAADLSSVVNSIDVAIDFSNVEAAADNARVCSAAGVPLLIGTTGLKPETLADFDIAAKRIAILPSANTSLALNVLVELVRRAAAALPDDFDIEVFEAHHRHKVDAPSGTALLLAEAAALGRGIALSRPVIPTGTQPGPRTPGQIGFSVIRGGDVVGEHEVRLLGAGEQLRLGHVASDRAVFARGALAAACWLAAQRAGRYTMADFLFENQKLT
jgi:4-hydroxy-tetrahydrodipicolinate reductase